MSEGDENVIDILRSIGLDPTPVIEVGSITKEVSVEPPTSSRPSSSSSRSSKEDHTTYLLLERIRCAASSSKHSIVQAKSFKSESAKKVEELEQQLRRKEMKLRQARQAIQTYNTEIPKLQMLLRTVNEAMEAEGYGFDEEEGDQHPENKASSGSKPLADENVPVSTSPADDGADAVSAPTDGAEDYEESKKAKVDLNLAERRAVQYQRLSESLSDTTILLTQRETEIKQLEFERRMVESELRQMRLRLCRSNDDISECLRVLSTGASFPANLGTVPSESEIAALTKSVTESRVSGDSTPRNSQTRPSSSQSNRPGSSQSNRPGSSHSNRPGSSHSNRPGSSQSNRPGSSQSTRPGSSQSIRPGSSHSSCPGSSHSARPDSERGIRALQADSTIETDSSPHVTAQTTSSGSTQIEATHSASSHTPRGGYAPVPSPRRTLPDGSMTVPSENDPIVSPRESLSSLAVSVARARTESIGTATVQRKLGAARGTPNGAPEKSVRAVGRPLNAAAGTPRTALRSSLQHGGRTVFAGSKSTSGGYAEQIGIKPVGGGERRPRPASASRPPTGRTPR